MDVIVCHISALHYWLSHIGSPRIDALQSALAPQLGIPLRESEIAAAVSILPEERQREKVHLLTKTHEAARHSHDIAVHTTSLELTPADFHLAAPGVFVCTPEFALIQSAQTLDEIEFLRIAFALCGTYRVGTNDAYPLTTPLKINQMLTRMTGLNGAKPARRLTPYILAGAASPRETQLVLHLCLPYRMGGYGIAYPQLNPRIDLPAHVQRLTGNSVLFPDLFWPDKHIAVEYDIPGPITVPCDVDMVKTIMRNLMSNAIKYSNEGGRIVISVRETPTHAVISVRDFGTGISEENLPKLLNPDA